MKSLFAVAAVLVSIPAFAQDAGTRVSITLAKPAELPQADKLVEALQAVGGGEREVQAQKKQTETQSELQLDLWGAWTPSSEIASTLRDAFPVLKGAQISVSTLDASLKPQPPKDDDGKPADGKRKIIKKVIKTEETAK